MFIDTRERPAGEVQQKVGRIKLSEAIRIGARIGPQISKIYLDGNGGSCAIGAAFMGFGLSNGNSFSGGEWDSLIALCGIENPAQLHCKITIRNDSGESRESIATWLESQGL